MNLMNEIENALRAQQDVADMEGDDCSYNGLDCMLWSWATLNETLKRKGEYQRMVGPFPDMVREVRIQMLDNALYLSIGTKPFERVDFERVWFLIDEEV